MTWNEILNKIGRNGKSNGHSPHVFVMINIIPETKGYADSMDLNKPQSWTKMEVKDIKYYPDSNHIIISIDSVKT